MNAFSSRRPTLVLATRNRHKVREIRSILRKAGVAVRLKTAADFPNVPEVEEDRKTLVGNAAKKAREVAKASGHFALADDTGLFVKALKGAPGVYSARFAGPQCSFRDNNRKLLRLLRGKAGRERAAEFRCVAALSDPRGRVRWAIGRISGRIGERMRGEGGFGYDPVFLPDSNHRSFAEIGAAEKNRISHRGRAFRQVPALLRAALRGARMNRR